MVFSPDTFFQHAASDQASGKQTKTLGEKGPENTGRSVIDGRLEVGCVSLCCRVHRIFW